MQTCFETGNDKLYIQIKKKLFIGSTNSLTGTSISVKQALVVVDFAVPALNIILTITK